MTATTYLTLTLPTVGGDSDNWGTDLNADLVRLDALWATIGYAAFGAAATKATSFFAQAANNLSDLSNATTARTNLGLDTAATKAISFFAQAANNLSDLSNATTARSNLGLGSGAVASTGASGHALPFLDGTNTWSGAQTFSGGLTGTLTGNCSGSSGSCTGNAASASTAARVDLASGAAIDWDGTNIRFIIGGVVKAYVNPTAGLTNNV